MVNDLEWGGRDEETVTKLARRYWWTGKAEGVEAALNTLQSFDQVEAAVRESGLSSAGGRRMYKVGWMSCGEEGGFKGAHIAPSSTFFHSPFHRGYG
jgi:hypothetical protein